MNLKNESALLACSQATSEPTPATVTTQVATPVVCLYAPIEMHEFAEVFICPQRAMNLDCSRQLLRKFLCQNRMRQLLWHTWTLQLRYVGGLKPFANFD